MNKKETKPFFARFLEGMNNERLDQAKAGATMKYPSDDDENITHKYPSDEDEIVTRKITDIYEYEEEALD